MLLVATSICYCKRTMIIVDNIVNSVDLLNMQTYCQVTSKKKKIEYTSSSYPLL